MIWKRKLPTASRSCKILPINLLIHVWSYFKTDSIYSYVLIRYNTNMKQATIINAFFILLFEKFESSKLRFLHSLSNTSRMKVLFSITKNTIFFKYPAYLLFCISLFVYYFIFWEFWPCPQRTYSWCYVTYRNWTCYFCLLKIWE